MYSSCYNPYILLQEYQKGNPNLVVENAEMNNVVYMFRCRESSLTVRGKVNGVVLDSCTKCAVVFDNLVSSVEFVNCQSVQMQVSCVASNVFSGCDMLPRRSCVASRVKV